MDVIRCDGFELGVGNILFPSAKLYVQISSYATTTRKKKQE